MKSFCFNHFCGMVISSCQRSRCVIPAYYRLFSSAKATSCVTNVIGKLEPLVKTVTVKYDTLFVKERRLQDLFEISHQLASSTKMSQPLNLKLSPPSSVRGMLKLDKTKFISTVHVPSLTVNNKKLDLMLSVIRSSLLKMPHIKPIASLPDNHPQKETHKLCLLDPVKRPTQKSFSESETNDITSFGLDIESWNLCELRLAYDNWDHAAILKAVLPEDSDTVKGFAQIGHIVHLNLREDLLPYRHLIGEVLLDKVSAAKTIVNKTAIIDNSYRNFALEVLAGNDDMMTVAHEHGCSFELDFSKVYWNPRLGTEHRRIVSKLSKGDVLFDLFAGIGPFAIPAAKKKCSVFANDLNPESYRWLKSNADKNHVQVNAFNMDARDFVRDVMKPELATKWHHFEEEYRIHVTMNLPRIATTFLDVFRDLFNDMSYGDFDRVVLPIVHVYGFSNAENTHSDMRMRVEEALKDTLPADTETRFVRLVAPFKEMICVSFTLSQAYLFGEMSSAGAEPEPKKSKLEIS